MLHIYIASFEVFLWGQIDHKFFQLFNGKWSFEILWFLKDSDSAYGMLLFIEYIEILIRVMALISYYFVADGSLSSSTFQSPHRLYSCGFITLFCMILSVPPLSGTVKCCVTLMCFLYLSCCWCLDLFTRTKSSVSFINSVKLQFHNTVCSRHCLLSIPISLISVFWA